MSPLAHLRGRIVERGPGFAVIEVGGVGLKVQVPGSTAARLGQAGQEGEVFTHLALSQFGATLYGFATAEERDLFEGLIGVTGITPKMALGILSAASVDELRGAIAAGDVERLVKLPGLGRKSASRVILELKGRLPEVEAPVPAGGPVDADVVAALVGLGYTQAEASAAAAAVPSDGSLTLEEKIRAALGHFASRG